MYGFGMSPLEVMASEAMLQGLVFLDQFIYSAEWVAGTASELGSLQTVEQPIQINGDSDFVWQEANITSLIEGDEEGSVVCDTCPNYKLTIVRSGAGREVMDGAQHVQNILGNHFNNAIPGKLPMPGLIQAKNTLTLRLQNLTTVVPVRVQISLIGFKVFYVVNAAGKTGTRREVFHAL